MTVPATVGALLLGGFIAIFLSGTVCVQSYLYFKTYPNDSRGTKTLVAVIWLLDILHSGFICASLWHYLIAQYGHAEKIDFIPTTLALSIACTAILTINVHCFFAYRIYTFSRGNFHLPAAVVVLAVLRLCAASVTTGEMIRLQSFVAYKRHFRPVFTLGLALSSTVDVLITATLCYFLRASRTKSRKLNSIIDSLLLYTFENGAITSAFTITSMFFWLLMSQNLIFMGLHFIIAKLYANSLLATLHARETLRRRRSERTKTDGEGPAPVTFLSQRTVGMNAGQMATPGVEISVMKTVECNVDDADSHDYDPEDKQEKDYEGSDEIVQDGNAEFVMYPKKKDLESGGQN